MSTDIDRLLNMILRVCSGSLLMGSIFLSEIGPRSSTRKR